MTRFGAGVLFFSLLAGCWSYPAPRPSPPAPQLDTPRALCSTIVLRQKDDSTYWDHRELVDAYAGFHKMIPLSVEAELVPSQQMEKQGYKPLLGEVLLLKLRSTAVGPQAGAIGKIVWRPFLIHDGTRYEPAIRSERKQILPSGNHDLARALFAKTEPKPLGPDAAERAKHSTENGTLRRDGTRQHAYDAKCVAQDTQGSCQALVPVARISPGWGPDVLGLEIEFTIGDRYDHCILTDRRSIELPTAASLEEQLQELFRKGPFRL